MKQFERKLKSHDLKKQTFFYASSIHRSFCHHKENVFNIDVHN